MSMDCCRGMCGAAASGVLSPEHEHTHAPGERPPIAVEWSHKAFADLTPAELYGRSGRDLITAMVLTYEVFGKIVNVMSTRALGVDQSTLLGMASVVGAGQPVGVERPLVGVAGQDAIEANAEFLLSGLFHPGGGRRLGGEHLLDTIAEQALVEDEGEPVVDQGAGVVEAQ